MSPERRETLRQQIVETSHRIHANGWVANHDGNLSARLSGDLLLCTPTAVSKGDVQPGWLIEVDKDGTVVHGTRRAFSELQLHRAAYAARPDISVVIHAHPPTATGFAVAGVPLDPSVMAEPIVSLGPEIPFVPYFRPGTPELTDAIEHALQRADVLLLERHGVLTVGGGFEQAYLRMELVEHISRISLVAHQLGHSRRLPEADVAALAERGRPKSMPTRLDEPGATDEASSSTPTRQTDLDTLVGDALNRYS